MQNRLGNFIKNTFGNKGALSKVKKHYHLSYIFTKKQYILFCIFLILSILYLLPVVDFSSFRFAIIRGDDYPFHFARIFSMIDQFNNGVWNASVSAFGIRQLFYGADIFYPTLTTIQPVALLSILFHSTVTGLYVYTVIINIMTFIIAYSCGKYIINHAIPNASPKFYRLAPYLFSLIYTFSHYRMICFYERMALGEFVSLTMYPMIFAGFYSILKDNGRNKHWLILGIAFIAYSHLLSLLLVITVLLVIFLYFLIRSKITWKMTKQFIFSAVLSLGLSAASLVPIVYEMLTLKIRSVSSHDLASEAYSAFLIAISSISNYLSYMSVGILLFIALSAGLYQFIQNKESLVKRNPLTKFCLFSSLFFLIALTTWFPWKLIQNTPIAIMQFPFRLMSFLTIFGSFLGAILFADYLVKRKKQNNNYLFRVLFGLLSICFLSVKGLILIRNTDTLMYSKEDIITTQRYQNSVNRDYFPANITAKQRNDIINKIGYINNQKTLMSYKFEKNAATLDFSLTEKINTIVTPIIGYSGLVVKDQNGKFIKTKLSLGRTLSFILPQGSHSVSVYYSSPFMIQCS